MYYGLRVLCLSVLISSSVWGQRASVKWEKRDEDRRMAVKHRWLNDGEGDMANPASWLDGTVPATKATGVLVFLDVALHNETVTIDAKVYTFQTALTDVDGNVLRGTSAADSNNNLIAAITLGAGAGTLYAASMTLHPTVTAVAQSSDTMDATAKLKGTDGNSIATTETVTSADWDDTTLLGATQWATDDEIIVGDDATQDFTTNLDWSTTTTSPELRLARMNVDRTRIAFGAPGNPLKFSLANVGALNYLGTGVMHADLKGSMYLFVNSATSQRVLVLNVRGNPLTYGVVNSGEVEIVAGALIANAAESHILTTGPFARLLLKGADEDGPRLLIAIEGLIENERARAAGLDPGWIIVGQEGTIIQKGQLHAGDTGGGILNLGGSFSFEPINEPVSQNFEGRFMAGVSRFDGSAYDVGIRTVFQGAQAELLRGPLNILGDVDVDFADDFPF
jgi:hypothetical protein